MSEFDNLRTPSELSLLRSQFAAMRANTEGPTISRRPSEISSTPVSSVPEEREAESVRSSRSRSNSSAQGGLRGVIDIYLDASSTPRQSSQKTRARGGSEELTLTKSKTLPFPPAYDDGPKNSPKNTLFPPFVPGKAPRQSSGIKKKRKCIVQ